MNRKPCKQYSPEFKLEALRLATVGDKYTACARATVCPGRTLLQEYCSAAHA